MGYLDDYRRYIDERVARDPRMAAGGRWEEIGGWQFNLLVRRGLTPNKRLLDIGCGTLRGGRHFIRYLNPSNYTGLDLSTKALKYAGQLVVSEGLALRQPRLILCEGGRLTFKVLIGETFDFILAQSVFTHLPPALIAECLEHLPQCMHGESRFYFTFSEAPVSRRVAFLAWEYSWCFIKELFQLQGFVVSREPMPDEQRHPRGLETAQARLGRS